MILDRRTWTPSCYPLGHWYISKLVNLKHCIPNIQPLQWNPADISFPWMITSSKISHFLLQLYIIKWYNFHPTSAFRKGGGGINTLCELCFHKFYLVHSWITWPIYSSYHFHPLHLDHTPLCKNSSQYTYLIYKQAVDKQLSLKM